MTTDCLDDATQGYLIAATGNQQIQLLSGVGTHALLHPFTFLFQFLEHALGLFR